MKHRILNCLFMLAALALLGACGGGFGSGASVGAPAVAPATPVAAFKPAAQSAVLGAAGGSVVLTATDGTRFQLDLPAGVLASSTTLTLTTQAPVAGQQFNLLLQPSGLVLAGGGVGTLTITLPAAAALPATGGLVYDGVLVPYTRLPDGRLQVRLSAFATAATPTASALASDAVLKRIAAASASVCGSAPALQSNGGLAALTAVDIELYGQCMVSAVQELAVTGQFTQAVRVALSVSAYLQATGSGNAGQLLAQASSLACTAYGLALERARSTSVTSMGTLYDLVKPIMFWEKTVQQLGATCPGIGAADYQTVIHTKTGEAQVYYAQQKPAITDTSSAAYTAAKAEAVRSIQARNEVLALSPPAALANTLNAEITQRAMPAVVDALLQAPWLRCRNTGNYDELMSLMDSLGSPESVKSAAQYCGTQMAVEVLNSQNQSTDSLSGLGGVAAGQNQTTGSLSATVDGIIKLTGPIAALRCPANAAGSEELLLRFAGVEVRRLGVAPYLAGTLQLNISNLRAAASLATTNTDPQQLTIERVGAACSGYWGATPAPLLAVTLSVKIQQLAFGTDRSYVWGIYFVNADGTGFRKINDEFARGASMSPDGSKVVWANTQGDVHGIKLMILNVDGSGQSTLDLGTDFYLLDPSWSPDGRKIAFSQMDVYDIKGVSQICTANADGSGKACFGGNGDAFHHPSWSPDGTRLTFSGQHVLDDVYALRPADIYTAFLDGSGKTKLTDSASVDNWDPSWSPDGQRISYTVFNRRYPQHDNVSVYVMNADGSGQSRVATANQSFWAPDSKRLFLATLPDFPDETPVTLRSMVLP